MRKLIAVICAIVMVMALAVPALAAGSPSTEVVGDGITTVDPAAFPAVVASAITGGLTPEAVVNTLGGTAPVDLADYVQITGWAQVMEAGTKTVTIPALAGVTDLTGYMLMIVTADGQVVFLDLAQFADSYDSTTGTLTIDFPVAGAFTVIAPKA